MAITETAPVATRAPANPWDMGEEVPAGAQVLGTGDHKTLGRIWIGFSALFGLAALVAAALTALDGLGDLTVVPEAASFRVFTASELGLALLFAVPLFIGAATYAVPVQVGAATIAFPRAAAAALWTWLLGSVLAIVGYAVDGGVAGVRTTGVDLTYLGLILVIASLLLATVCIVTTVLALRTDGLRLDRISPFSWSMLVAGTMWLLTLPVLAGNMLLIYVDFHYGSPSEFGLADLQWGQLSWAFQPPQVFAYAIPVLGLVTEAFLAATRPSEDDPGAGGPGVRRGALLAAIGAYGILTFGAWAQPAFNSEVTTQALYVGMCVVILLPILALAGGWADLMRRGGLPQPSASLGAASLAVLTLLLAGLASALSAIGLFGLDKELFASFAVTLVFATVVLGGISGLGTLRKEGAQR